MTWLDRVFPMYDEPEATDWEVHAACTGWAAMWAEWMLAPHPEEGETP